MGSTHINRIRITICLVTKRVGFWKEFETALRPFQKLPWLLTGFSAASGRSAEPFDRRGGRGGFVAPAVKLGFLNADPPPTVQSPSDHPKHAIKIDIGFTPFGGMRCVVLMRCSAVPGE